MPAWWNMKDPQLHPVMCEELVFFDPAHSLIIDICNCLQYFQNIFFDWNVSQNINKLKYPNLNHCTRKFYNWPLKLTSTSFIPDHSPTENK